MRESLTGEGPARPRTSRQLDRQFRAYQLHVDGKTIRQIAAELHCARDTVISDLRIEGERRSAALAESRDAEIAKSVSFYEAIIARALQKSRINDAIAAKILRGGKDAPRSVNDRSLADAIKARERIDKVLGVERIVKDDSALTELLNALAPPKE